MKTSKQLIALLWLFVATIIVGCSSNDDLSEPNTPAQPTGQGPEMTLSLDGSLFTPEQTRASFEIVNGYPQPANFAKGTTLPVLCIFRSTDSSQPITRAIVNWEVIDNDILRADKTQKVTMAAGTDLSKGKWYVMGIMGGTPQQTNGQYDKVQVARQMKMIDPNSSFEADVPFVFGWRAISANGNANHMAAEQPVVFMPTGVLMRVNITNKLNFDMKFSGIRMISSSPTEGNINLSDQTVRAMKLEDTPNTLKADNATYNDLLTFEATTESQRLATDGRNIGAKNRTSRLFYNDLKLNQDIELKDKTTANQQLCVWVMPQPQKVSVYNTDENAEGETSEGEVRDVFKTQFMLHATPSNPQTSPAINMIPLFGTTDALKSGEVNRLWEGNVVFRYTPLHHLTRFDNIASQDQIETRELSENVPTDTRLTKRYSRAELKKFIKDNRVGSQYIVPGRAYWNSLMTYGGFFGTIGGSTPSRNYYGMMVPSNFGNNNGYSDDDRKKLKLIYANYNSSYNATPANIRGKVAYALNLAKPSVFLTETQKLGYTFRGAHVKRDYRDENGVSLLGWAMKIYSYDPMMSEEYTQVATSNSYQYALRINMVENEEEKNRVELQARYLGDNFVLDIMDVSDEIFWETGRTNTKADFVRYIPLAGYNLFAGKDWNPESERNKNLFFQGGAQYWIPERYKPFENMQEPFSTFTSFDQGYYKAQTYMSVTFNGFQGMGGYWFPIGTSQNINAAIRLICRDPYND